MMKIELIGQPVSDFLNLTCTPKKKKQAKTAKY